MMGTTKHVMFGCNFDDGLRDTFGMVARIAGGEEALRARPLFSISSCMIISPLKFCTQPTLNVRTAAELEIPTTITSAPMSGSTSPMTMAGTLLQTHAEELAGITVHQLYRSGAPVLYGGLPAMADMASMGYQGGGVECGIMQWGDEDSHIGALDFYLIFNPLFGRKVSGVSVQDSDCVYHS